MPTVPLTGVSECLSLPLLLRLPASLFAIALTGQRLLETEFLAELQIKGVSFDFADDVLLNNLVLGAKWHLQY
jgi:hypothetical protein